MVALNQDAIPHPQSLLSAPISIKPIPEAPITLDMRAMFNAVIVAISGIFDTDGG